MWSAVRDYNMRRSHVTYQYMNSYVTRHESYRTRWMHTNIDRKKHPPQGGFLFTMFPHQAPWLSIEDPFRSIWTRCFERGPVFFILFSFFSGFFPQFFGKFFLENFCWGVFKKIPDFYLSCHFHAIRCQPCRPIRAQPRLSFSLAGSTWNFGEKKMFLTRIR